MTFSSTAVARTTYSFVLSHLATCARIVWLPLALMFALAWLVGPRLFAECPLFCGSQSGSGFMAAGWLLLFVVGCAILLSMIHAALWRYVLRGGDVSTPFYFSLGGDELRLLSLWLLEIILVFAIGFAVALATGLAAFAAGRISGALFAPAFAFAALLTLLTVSWVAARWSLAGPAAIDARGGSLAASWRATRQRVAQLGFVNLLLSAPLVIIALALLVLFVATMLPSLHPGGLPLSTPITARACARFLVSLVQRLPILLLGLYLVSMLLLSLAVAGRAIAYRMAEFGPSGGGKT